MLSLRKASFVICMIVSVFCLVAGYGITGPWMGTLSSILMIPAWLFARKYPDSWLPYVCLLASICLAVIGKLTGAAPLIMIFGSGVALAVWDLLYLDVALGSNSSGEQTRQYENKHLQSLTLALGFGLLVAFLGRFVNLQIPFIPLMLLVLLALFELERAYGYIKKRRMHIGDNNFKMER
jgi:hypothetical protein